MSDQIFSILSLALMCIGALGGAFEIGTRQESNKQAAKYHEEIRIMLNLTKGIRDDIDSGELPTKYRD